MNYESLWQLYPLAREQLVNIKTRSATKLKGTECRVLEILIAQQGQVVSKRELFEKVWGERVVSENSLTQCIAQLRVALGDSGKEQKFIKTVPSHGYMLFENVVELAQIEQPSKELPVVSTPRQSESETEFESVKEYGYRQQFKLLLALVLAIVLLFQGTSAIHRWTFSLNVPLDAWIKVQQGERGFFYFDNKASKAMYKYLSKNSNHLSDSPVTELLISTGVNHYYLSCIYRSETNGDQQVKNLNFSLRENFYFIGETVRDVCR
ncbi:winged helix-turn-helix domain-containing protein [Vibrio hepatarius]|uniref:winged helix-turn-helix domain-containing protein n=1 Tax=Vibrio hepatarius TaxID=171383 RepID=UPI001C08D274|nr:winged helix-turn-helix domain-containing protein [Vibrio hepatarius]MBU2897452.1 winged helix-turn-helix domain-containing protein [Vibrio hepatarius]